MTYDTTLLSRTHRITIAKYRSLEQAQDRQALADFIYERFAERYIWPMESTPKEDKNGFSIMAVSCLMIEAVETFRQGWPNSKNRSTEAFRKFFADTRTTKEPLAEFDQMSEQIYIHVRCGILHQAETTGGWRISRSGPLYDPATKTINATVFLRRLRRCLKNYCTELRQANWNDLIWVNFRIKMDAVCENCKTTP